MLSAGSDIFIAFYKTHPKRNPSVSDQAIAVAMTWCLHAKSND